jgi:hypothetical protein
MDLPAPGLAGKQVKTGMKVEFELVNQCEMPDSEEAKHTVCVISHHSATCNGERGPLSVRVYDRAHFNYGYCAVIDRRLQIVEDS